MTAEVRRWVGTGSQGKRSSFEVPPSPVRVVVRISPAQFGLPDERQFGAQVSFRFEPPR
jgi:hypothetical protein